MQEVSSRADVQNGQCSTCEEGSKTERRVRRAREAREVKRETVEYICDLCSSAKEAGASNLVPYGWSVVNYEPTDRTFAEKHVCKECVADIAKNVRKP